jgi:hypothetical protein
VLTTLRSRLSAALAALAISLPVVAAAHPGHDEHVTQNAALLSAIVSLGGGAEHFNAATFRRTVSSSVPDEDRTLRTTLGTAVVDRFDNVFTYVVNDGLATLKRAGKPLPAPTSTDAKTVAAGLYQAGLHDGAFDVEHLFDTLFSPEVHSHAMVAVGRKYGQDGETAYHVVLARLVQDLGKS